MVNWGNEEWVNRKRKTGEIAKINTGEMGKARLGKKGKQGWVKGKVRLEKWEKQD